MKEILAKRVRELLPCINGEQGSQNRIVFETYCMNLRLLKELFPDEYAKFTEKR